VILNLDPWRIAADRIRALRRHEFCRFIVVGAINTIATYVIYVCLVLIVAYPIAYTVTTILGIFLSYTLNATLVFRRKLTIAGAVQYPVVYIVQYVVGLLLLYLLVEKARLNKFYAPLLIVAATVPVTYLLSRLVIRRG
jgi:putative flippase GtrA